MADKFRGVPPPPKGDRTDVVRVKSTDPQTFTFLSDKILGVLIHWNGKRSCECTKDQGECAGCASAWPLKWKGYMHCIAWNDKRNLVFLELTARACEVIEQFVPERGTLRGLIVRIGKTKGGAKGRYTVDVLERRTPEAEMPVDQDPLDTLRFLWQVKQKTFAA